MTFLANVGTSPITQPNANVALFTFLLPYPSICIYIRTFTRTRHLADTGVQSSHEVLPQQSEIGHSAPR